MNEIYVINATKLGLSLEHENIILKCFNCKRTKRVCHIKEFDDDIDWNLGKDVDWFVDEHIDWMRLDENDYTLCDKCRLPENFMENVCKRCRTPEKYKGEQIASILGRSSSDINCHFYCKPCFRMLHSWDEGEYWLNAGLEFCKKNNYK